MAVPDLCKAANSVVPFPRQVADPAAIIQLTTEGLADIKMTMTHIEAAVHVSKGMTGAIGSGAPASAPGAPASAGDEGGEAGADPLLAARRLGIDFDEAAVASASARPADTTAAASSRSSVRSNDASPHIPSIVASVSAASAATAGSAAQVDEAFATMDPEKTNAYLDYLKDQGRLEESVYREMVAANLATDDQKFFYLPDETTIASNASGSIYDDYRIVQFDELDKEYDSPSSIEGFTDEQNERRATIAMLDAGNVSFSDVQKGMKKPEKKKWYEDPLGVLKSAGESWFYGGTKELGPAIENVLKGEANSQDWLQVTPFALEMAEVITPGVSRDDAQELGEIARADALANGATAATAVQAGKDAYDTARLGKGFVFGDLYTMGYNESKAAINATLTGNLDEFAKQRVTAVAFEKGMDAIGDTDLVKSMSPKVREATHKTLVDLANGKSLEDSLKDQAEDYGEEVLEDWAEERWDEWKPKLEQMGRDFDDNYLQPLKDMLPDGGQARKFLSDFDDEVVQKFTKPIGDLGSDIDDNVIQPVRDFVEDNVIDPIDDAIDEFGDELPDGPDLPDDDDFDFPDMPDFGRFLSVLGPLAGMPGYAPPEEEKGEDDLMQFAEPYDFSGDSIFRDRAQEKRFGITRDSDTLLTDINANINDTNLDEFAGLEGLDGVPQLSRFRGF